MQTNWKIRDGRVNNGSSYEFCWQGLGLGETRALARTLTKLLVKKFGILTEDLKKGIQKLDATTLEILIDNIDGYSNLEDLKNYIQ